jgi:hypothetical protein
LKESSKSSDAKNTIGQKKYCKKIIKTENKIIAVQFGTSIGEFCQPVSLTSNIFRRNLTIQNIKK